MLLFCLLAAAACALVFAAGREESRMLRIFWDGAEIKANPEQKKWMDVLEQDGTQYCLLRYNEGGIMICWYEERDAVPSVSEGMSYNLFSVSDGRVRMEAADCPDQTCVHHIPISETGENIICLPHKLVVEITGGADETETPDGMAKAESTNGEAGWNHGTLRNGGSHETDG